MIKNLAAASTEVWSRRIVTRAHLDSAVYLLLQDAPRCSVNLLAAASLDVLRGVLAESGKPSVVDEMLELVPDDKRKEAIKLFKSPYNYCKHADKDADEDFVIFTSFCDFTIFMASYDYKKAYEKWSFRMLIFAWWFAANNDAWLQGSEQYRAAPKSDLFARDRTPTYALSVIDHVEKNPTILTSLMRDLGQDWIELR